MEKNLYPVSSGLGLVAQHLCTSLLGLLLVNVLHENALVLEHITLCLHVQLVVQMSVDFLGLAVLLEQATQNSHAGHPEELDWHTSVRCTLPLTVAAMSALSASDGVFADAITGVNYHGLLDDQTILDQLADVLA